MRIFNDVKDVVVGASTLTTQGRETLRNVSEFKIGTGERAFKAGNEGMWLGANKFADAPFKVDLDGNIYLQSADGKLVIDTVNNRIVIYDADGVPRVLLGYQENGF